MISHNNFLVSIEDEASHTAAQLKYESVINKSQFSDDQVKIMLAWQNYLSVTLRSNYQDKDLIFLHNFDTDLVVEQIDLHKFENYYTLFIDGKKRLSFNLCRHGVYTPLSSTIRFHSDCIECEE
jgi:hypothetical protein